MFFIQSTMIIYTMFTISVFESPEHFIAVASDLFDYPELGIRQLQSLLVKSKNPSLSLQYTVELLRDKPIQSMALTICRFTSQLADLSEGTSMSASLQKHLVESSLLTEIRHAVTHGQMPSYQTISIGKQLILKNIKAKFWDSRVIEYVNHVYCIDWDKVQRYYQNIYENQFSQIDPEPAFERRNSLSYISGYRAEHTNLFQTYCHQHPPPEQQSQQFNNGRSIKQYILDKYNITEDNQPKNPRKKQQLVIQLPDYKFKQHFCKKLESLMALEKHKYCSDTIQLEDFGPQAGRLKAITQKANLFQRKVIILATLNQFKKAPSSKLLFSILQESLNSLKVGQILNDNLIMKNIKMLMFIKGIGKVDQIFKSVLPQQVITQANLFWEKYELRKLKIRQQQKDKERQENMANQ